MIHKRLSEIHPSRLLDIGCGCGKFTATLSPFCDSIEAIDPAPHVIERCTKEQSRTNISYKVMDGTSLQYGDKHFDVSLIRGSLHHIQDWKKVLKEAIRVTRKMILIEEPVTDLRSESKRNREKAQNLFLEIQAEAHWPHFPHIPIAEITNFLRQNGLRTEYVITRSNDTATFDEFFGPFQSFVEKTNHPEYWIGRLNALRSELGNGPIAEDDLVFIEGAL